MTLDDARAAHPGFGFALYAFEPGGPVTMEVIALDGSIFPFTGPSEQAVLDLAFPPAPPPNVFD